MTALAATPAQQITIAAPKATVPLIQAYTKDLPVGDAGWAIRVIPPAQWKGPAQSNQTGHMPHAYSDLKNRVTYLRGDFIQLPPEVTRRILTHEMGHLTLNTTDEDKVNKWADSWLRSHSSR